MPEEPQFIVLNPDGRKSKPATEARIREMYECGKIADDAIVQTLGSDFETPLLVFLGLPGSQPVELQQAESEAAEVTAALVPEPPFAEKPLPKFRRRSRNRATAGFVSVVAVILAWPIRGFLIPTSGVNPTRNYLRRTIRGIEVWIRMIHLASLGVLLIAAFTTVTVLTGEAGLLRQNGIHGVWQLLIRVAIATSFYFAVFLSLIIGEAFLRVIPASLRYWIEATEERREIDRANQIGNSQ